MTNLLTTLHNSIVVNGFNSVDKTPFKGGRNHKAPYQTTHLRVPEDLKSVLQGFVDIYKVVCSLDEKEGLKTFKRDLEKFLSCFEILGGKLYVNMKLVDEATEFWIQKEFRRQQEQLNAWENLHKEQLANHEKAKDLLIAALLLKPNAGGAIKKEILKALELLS